MFTHKQKLYAEARLKGLNQTQAAIAAGYSPDTARQSASRLEKSPEVIACMDRLRQFGGIEPAPAVKKEKPPKPTKPTKAIDPASMPEAAPQPEPEKQTEAKDPPKAHEPPVMLGEFTDPLEFMRHVMNDPVEDMRLRLDASKALAGFLHAKPGEKGKKENAKEEAERIAGKSKYTPGAKPRLVASN
jgi:phage terminase small subunit